MHVSTLAQCPQGSTGTYFQSKTRNDGVRRRPSRQLHIARAGFDEGAAQVRRLLDRDRKELDFDKLDSAFADDPSTSTSSNLTSLNDIVGIEATPASAGARFSADKTPVSPFGSSNTSNDSTISPFGSPSISSSKMSTATTKSPFEPEGLSPTMQPDVVVDKPWWTRITLTQIVIVLSFTTIISLMIATFFFVLNVGAVRFNE